jgi:UrcA family protein
MNKQTLAAALVCGATLLAAPAFAQPVMGTQLQYVVHYSDLDLSRAEGAHMLLSRLDGAARIVCSPAADSADLGRIALFNSCVKDTMERAVAAVHMPLVSELYNRHVTAIAEN